MRYQLSSCIVSSINTISRIQFQKRSLSPTYHIACCSFHSFQNDQHSWSVLKYIYKEQPKKLQKSYACLLLNISNDSFSHFLKYKYIWNDANLKLAVDGSADCLADKKLIHEADIVCGDFDSINPKLLDQLRCPDALKLYGPESKETSESIRMPQVIETPGQRETDFTKALRIVLSKRPDIQHFFGIYHSDGTRIDHLFGLINTLHLIKRHIILINVKSNTISWLLKPGNHTIQKPRGRELCSLVPFTRSAEVKTLGLEYDMRHPTNLDFSSLISTSNMCKYPSESIVVDTNRELLWSIDIQEKKLNSLK